MKDISWTQWIAMAWVVAAVSYHVWNTRRLENDARFWKKHSDEWKDIAKRWKECVDKLVVSRDDWKKQSEDWRKIAEDRGQLINGMLKGLEDRK